MSAAVNFINRLRAEIRNLPLYNAGVSSEYLRARYPVRQVAKLGSNENAYGASPKALSALAAAIGDVALYPDPYCEGLRSALSQRLHCAPNRLIFGNGSDDLIALASQTFLWSGDEVVTLAPSYGLHRIWPQSVGASMRAVPVRPDYQTDIAGLIAALTPRTRMLLFSNPSNPVGTSIAAQDMSRLLAALDRTTLLVFDEAYFEYAAIDNSYPPFLQMLEQSDRPWLVLRTFSKAYGLAGLRIGYALASDAALVNLLDRVRGPFNVNRLAQVAAVAALEDQEYVQAGILQMQQERERVRLALHALGYHPAPSLANFLFFDARQDASELAQRLLPHGVIVKPWREPGFLEHVRVTIGSPQANDQFLAALASAARAAGA